MATGIRASGGEASIMNGSAKYVLVAILAAFAVRLIVRAFEDGAVDPNLRAAVILGLAVMLVCGIGLLIYRKRHEPPEPEAYGESLLGGLWASFKWSYWKPMIGVTIYTEDSPHLVQDQVEDELMKAVNGNADWLGASAGDVGQGSFFDITFEARRPKEVVAILIAKLREMKAGPKTEIHWKKNRILLGEAGNEDRLAPND